ncbi:MAG: hypothetical protein WCQ87_09890 [Parabacteroides sp.]
MRVKHGHDMTVGAEGPRLDFMLFGEVVYNSVRYPACNLCKNGHRTLLWVHGTSYGCVLGYH